MEFSDEEKIDLRREQIVLLVKKYYEKFEFLKFESLDLLINKTLGLFLNSDLSIEEINDKLLEAVLERKKDLDNRYGNEKIKQNHEELYGKLEQLFSLLNKEGIDCQVSGALCGYLKYNMESDRCHDDIDICLNENDIDKFRSICVNSGLMFEDNRFSSPRVLKNGILSGEHEVIARDLDSDFHIGVFCFERCNDGSVISKEYYRGDGGEALAREEIFSPELANEIYCGEEIEFRGTPISITPPEYIYILKSSSKDKKDMNDVFLLEDKVDMKKVEKIRLMLRDGKVVQNVSAESSLGDEIHNKYNDNDDDLGLMLADDEDSVDKNISKENNDIKVLRKSENEVSNNNDTSSEGGFAISATFSTLGIISFVICAIIFMIYYLLKC